MLGTRVMSGLHPRFTSTRPTMRPGRPLMSLTSRQVPRLGWSMTNGWLLSAITFLPCRSASDRRSSQTFRIRYEVTALPRLSDTAGETQRFCLDHLVQCIPNGSASRLGRKDYSYELHTLPGRSSRSPPGSRLKAGCCRSDSLELL